MRRLDLVGLAVACSLLAAGCSRLTFVKPSAQRGDSTQVAAQYDFSDDGQARGKASTRGHLLRGEQALRAGRYPEAAAEARLAMKIDGRDADAHTLLALALERQGDSREAGKHYARAAGLKPSGATFNNHGAWLCRNGRATESLAWFDRALADRSYASPASALANAGACADEGGQPGRTQRDLRAALALDPVNAVGLEALARHLHGRGDDFEARAFSERRLEAAPASPAALQLASQIEDKLGDKAAAARYVQRLRTEFPHAQAVLPGDSSSR
ncbi:type IV pilus biogenesis/stability protein PilW [Luteimonas sp. MC1825]|uniref:type IV pilus biogenesis/stability protein PilW n=1 Tax=Luteimonas sp. MC1825 TaxID=2761107 RepID=UPI00161E258A|nr:type IV pilus biogenesis/stability protein PilW [Luteimonas sp. MC1825]MBB6599250.1 type IV pilus biogenesis/stability protein PilW [Luteimonas sp. MC1825]QOC89365.1 type IV pilus biogenesis/stability protein PilW [Luteimonas sp. MC1825]